MSGADLLETATTAAAVMVLAAVALCLARLARGPSLVDRVVALDLLGLLVAGLIALAAIRYRQPALIDAAIALTLVGFLATIGYARYLERAGDEPTRPRPPRPVPPRTVFRHDRKSR